MKKILIFFLLLPYVAALVDYEPVYEEKKFYMPIYEKHLIKVPEYTFGKNDSFHEAYEYYFYTFEGYDYVSVQTKVIGYRINNIEYKNSYIVNETLVKWSFPVGDRNYQEFGKCREYEIEKGVCLETSLLEVSI